jgi:mannose-6-phosphate isomerase-like protein (cupin superfamily)
MPTQPFATAALPVDPHATAPDGTAVRLLHALDGGSVAHFELPAGAVSHAVTHRTVEEIWYVVAGRGRLWRKAGADERVEALAPGTSVTIPLGTAFQFRAEADGPFAFVAVTMPPWPGMDEAVAVEGPWAPTVPRGR